MPETERGFVADVRHVRETSYALEARDDRGHRLVVTFDPREDGPHVYSNVDRWTEPDATIEPEQREALLDAIARGLDAYFVRDTWTLWTATWPRFPLRWKGAHDHVVLLEGTERLLYAERGRAVVLPAAVLPSSRPGVPRVEVAPPRSRVRWSYPEDAGPIDAATWAAIVERIRGAAGLEVEIRERSARSRKRARS